MCRGYDLRRRKRAGLRMTIAALFGRWPYQCFECEFQFYLKKRYLNPRNADAQPGEKPDIG